MIYSRHRPHLSEPRQYILRYDMLTKRNTVGPAYEHGIGERIFPMLVYWINYKHYLLYIYAPKRRHSAGKINRRGKARMLPLDFSVIPLYKGPSRFCSQASRENFGRTGRFANFPANFRAFKSQNLCYLYIFWNGDGDRHIYFSKRGVLQAMPGYKRLSWCTIAGIIPTTFSFEYYFFYRGYRLWFYLLCFPI